MQLTMEERLRVLGERTGVASSLMTSVWRDLVARYAEPHRAFHTLDHVEEMLSRLPRNGGSDSVAWAVWFHDAIDDLRSSTNESDSAGLFRMLMGAALSLEMLADVERLIRATDPRRPRGQAADERLITDLDLGVLGSEPPAYRAYAAAVRKEYAFVPDRDFASGRVKIMTQFLKQPKIFLTDHHSHLEAQARANIQREIDELRKQIH